MAVARATTISRKEKSFHIPFMLLLLAGVGGLALFSLNKIHDDKKHVKHHPHAELDIITEKLELEKGEHPPPIPSSRANDVDKFHFHGIDVPNDKYNFGNDFDPITVPNFKKKTGTLYRMGWVVPNFEDVPTYQVDQESKTPFVPSYRHHLKNQPMLSRVLNDSYSIYNDDKRGDGFASYFGRVNSFNTSSASSSVGGTPVGPSSLISYGSTGVGAAVGDSINVGGGPADPYTSTGTPYPSPFGPPPPPGGVALWGGTGPGGFGGAGPPPPPFFGDSPSIPINQFQQQNQLSEFGPGGPQPVNSTDPVFDAAVADTDSIPSIVVNPGDTAMPHIIGVMNQVLKMIISNTTSVNTVLSNIDTIKQSIKRYGHKLHEAYRQVQIGNITPIQYNQFLMQVVSDVSNELQLPLNPTFAAQLNASPFQPISPAII